MSLNAILEWVILVLFLAAAIQVEVKLVSFGTRDSGGQRRIPFVQCGYWILAALAFNFLVYLMHGGEVGETWFSGYVLEYTLSVDNLFVFQLVFKMYKTPESQIDKALLWGISAAAVMRLFFFVIGTSLFEWVSWIKYPLGLLLLLTAWKTAKSKQHTTVRTPEEGASPTRQISTISTTVSEPEIPQFAANCAKLFPVSEHYDKHGNFFQYEHLLLADELQGDSGKLRLTMLGLVVLALTFIDVVFALDAVAAKVTQTGDVFTNFSSSLFAMAAFRSLYHIIAELTATFVLLKYGIAVILAYVGVELFLSNWVAIPNQISCIIILSACTFSIVGSLVYAKWTHSGYSLEMGSISKADNFGLEESN